MNSIFAFALLLLAGPALAQTWLTSPCSVAGPLYPVPTTAAKPQCLPAPKGAGTAPIVESNIAGAAAAWWCKQPGGKPPVLYLYAVRWEAITPALVTDLVLGALAGARTGAIQTATLKHQTTDIRDMCDVWGPAVPRIAAAKP